MPEIGSYLPYIKQYILQYLSVALSQSYFMDISLHQ